MAIEFTQYIRPSRRQKKIQIHMPEKIEALAQRFVIAGGYYESEVLDDDHTVSLTACFDRPEGDNDIAIEVVQNGPAVVEAVDRLVRNSVTWLETRNMREKNDIVLQQLLGLFKL